MALKLDTDEETVEFIIERLREGEYDLEPTEESFEEDPEDIYLRNLEVHFG